MSEQTFDFRPEPERRAKDEFERQYVYFAVVCVVVGDLSFQLLVREVVEGV
jgi:hypothetical protein